MTKYSASYRCPHKNLHACDLSDVGQPRIEQAFIEYAQKVADFEENEIQLEEQKQQKDKSQELIQIYHEKLNQLKLREKEILDLYIDGSIDFGRYREIKERIDKDKEEIHLELEKLSIPENDSKPEFSKEDFTLAFKENWEHLTNIEKRQFLMKFVKRIHFTSQKVENKRFNIITVNNVELA